MSLFITGTDTGVGKTHTAARLLQFLRESPNADVLRKVLDVPTLEELGKNPTELPPDRQLMLEATLRS